MARQWFKRAWKKIVPEPVERSTYVLLASLILLLLFWKWEPMKGIVWDVRNPNGRMILMGLFWIGWGLVLASTYLIDHFGLFGQPLVFGQFARKSEKSPIGSMNHDRREQEGLAADLFEQSSHRRACCRAPGGGHDLAVIQADEFGRTNAVGGNEFAAGGRLSAVDWYLGDGGTDCRRPSTPA